MATSTDNKQKTEVIDSLDDFKMQMAEAQLEKKPFLIVSEKLMRLLSHEVNVSSITYGKPGIRVYKAGTKELLDHEELMSAELYHTYLYKKTAQAK